MPADRYTPSSQTFPPATEEALQVIVAELQAREPIFHRADFYQTPEDFESLMAPGYWEVGASGRRYSRAFILEHLAKNIPVDAAAGGWTTTDFACQALGPATYLLTYTLAQGARLTRRATVWQRRGPDWQILYHHGTTVTGAPDNTYPGESGYIPRQP